MASQVQITIGGRTDSSLNSTFRSATLGLQQIARSLQLIERLAKSLHLEMGRDFQAIASTVLGAVAAAEALRRVYLQLTTAVRAYTAATAAAAVAETGLAAGGAGAAAGAARSMAAKTAITGAAAAGIGGAAAGAGTVIAGSTPIGLALIAGAAALYFALRKVEVWNQEMAAREQAMNRPEVVAAQSKALVASIENEVREGRLSKEAAAKLLDEASAAWDKPVGAIEQVAAALDAVAAKLPLPTREGFLSREKLLELTGRAAAVGETLPGTGPAGARVPLPSEMAPGAPGPGEPGFIERVNVQMDAVGRLNAELDAQRSLLHDINQAQRDGVITQEEYWEKWVKVRGQIVDDERKIKDMEEEINRERRRNLEQTLSYSAQMFGSFAELARTFGRRGFATWKAFSIAQAVVNTALMISNALAAAKPPINFILAAIAGASGAAQVATIARTQPQGFAFGGRPLLNEMSIVGERGPELFVPDTPGTVVPNHAIAGMGSVNVAIVRNYADARDFLQTVEGQAAILDIVGRNRGRLARTV